MKCDLKILYIVKFKTKYKNILNLTNYYMKILSHNKRFKPWITKFECETFNNISNLYSF